MKVESSVVCAWIAAIAVLMGCYVATHGSHVDTRFVVNETPSEPRGIYRLVRHVEADYRRGMFVVFPVPSAAEAWVYGRHWLAAGLPLLKEVAAIGGDEVCVFADHLEINRRRIGPVFLVDRQGLPLPQVRGCFVVQPGMFFAASHTLDRSFDGRYFGALPVTVIAGEAQPVWIF